MTGPYHYTPGIWPSVLTVLLLIALSVYAWKRRGVPGTLPFAIACLIAAPWAAGSVMQLAAVDAESKIFWFQFQGIWRLPAATAITCFILEYAWPGRWLTRRNLALLSIPPLLILGLTLTDDLHHLIWRALVYEGKVIAQRGLGNWMFLVYGYGLGMVNLIVFVWLFLRSPQHRWPVVIMVTGQMVGRGLYLLEAAQALQPALPIDVPPIVFEYLMYAIALFGFRLFDPIPLARQTVIAQMREGVLVLDPQGWVASLNPAAEQILGAPARRLRGRPARELLPAYPDWHLADVEETELELSFPEGHPLERPVGIPRDGVRAEQEVRHYMLAISHLKDWRGLAVGRLLLLHDVTEQRQAQAQIVEQQRALAMLHERERLARELHDSLGQVFAFVNAQGQTVRRLLDRGDVPTAEAYVDRLIEVAREADVDIRESILGLRATLSEQGFFPAVAQYLARYEKNYGIHTELDKPETFDDRAFEPLVEVELLRIVQEALTNVRKHARARRVRIAFTSEDGWACVTVQDDGQGFDPGAPPAGLEERVGLRVMRERAEEVGGSLSLHSTPGQGTTVVVRVPLREDAEKGRRGDVEREDAETR